MRKRNMKKVAMIITTAVVVVSAAVLNAIPVFAEPAEENGSSIVVNEGETVLDTADTDVLQNEWKALYDEVPDIVQIPAEGLTRKNSLKSNGTINYNDGTVLIRAADFAYLADEIDTLEYLYKVNVKNALNSINTYFAADGTIVRGRDMANVQEESALNLSFDKLYEGILQSQSVEHLANRQIYAAIADNLSFGTAAWVNGELLIGTGADNQTSYEKGYIEGFNKATDSVDISYVYHEHVGEQVDEGTGCYRGYHVHTSECPSYVESVYMGMKTCNWSSSSYQSDNAPSCPLHGGYTYSDSVGGGYTVYGCNVQYEYYENETKYTCNNIPYNAWNIVCGKTEGVTIDSVTLVFK